ncbi:MAG: hypothetical protein EWV40_15060 [Microcystis flos-aquae Mf_WU_F_19750830_S460]|uniref:Uncharacterized protein n=3 Tax=Microcystis TaxID=1125 RepID=A0A552LH36_9CHRO|nr:MAG: hypothetical protein EWV40_15060 [Microcystis flos-aquae Mf_WU_F_19750830_S460]CCH95905.1 hypothetical protein MICAB_1230002 [Microcystis aeruginosa PCC 9717]
MVSTTDSPKRYFSLLPPADRLFQVSPDEKIFTPTDERGFFPHTPHPTPHTLFPVRGNQGKMISILYANTFNA